MKFNKILLVIASFLTLAISSLGQNNIGTLVTDPIRPFSVSSTHPSAIANEIKGGPFTSSNLAGLSNIPAPRLEIGAIGYATNTGLYYRLTATNPATWSPIDGGNITNLNASNITGSIPFLNISNALTNASVAFGTATFNGAVQGPIGVATNPAFRFGTNQSGFYYGSQLGFGQSVAVSIFGSNIARFQSNRVVFDQPIDFLSPTSGSALTTRTNLGIQDFVTNPVVQVVSGGTGATNAANARQNLGSTTVGDALFIATNAASARAVIGALATNGSAAGLTNFPANILTTNGNGSGLTNLSASNVAGTIAVTQGGTGAINSGGARTNLGLGATNNVAFNSVYIGAGDLQFSNDSIFWAGSLRYSPEDQSFEGSIGINNGSIQFIGTNAAENIAATRTNLGLGATNNAFSSLSVGQLITNQASASNASSAFGRQITIGSAAENSFAAGFGLTMTNSGQAGGSILLGGMGTMAHWGAFLFNGVPQGGTAASSRGNSTFAVNASNGIYLNGSLFLEGVQGVATDSGILQISAGGAISRVMTNKSTATPAFFGWDGFFNTAFSAAQARTNIGLSATWLTNTNVTNFRTAIGLGSAGSVSFEEVFVSNALEVANGAPSGITIDADGIQFGATNAAITRSNLGLGWPALTNTNAGTRLVSVNTNGEVVSPTNFWQVSPANTRVQVIQPVVNATNTATNARNLFLYSLAISTTGVTNTIQLPTNGGTLLGDVATVIHEGPTSSITAVRQIGSGTNIITVNQFQEAVKFIYETGGWRLADNLSFVEAIYFSGTNAAANAAASRTNLGLGGLNNVAFNSVNVGEVTLVAHGIDATPWGGGELDFEEMQFFGNSGNSWNFGGSGIANLGELQFNNTTNAATTRANLGLPLAALTNTSNVTFQQAIFTTNAAPTNTANVNGIGFNTAVAWMSVSIVTNGVTNSYRIPLFQ